MNPGHAVGVFGGTFDPIHLGHLAAADDAASALDLDQILFIPNRIPPHKEARAVAAAPDRLAMLRLAISGNPRFAISTIELERDGPSYSLDTMRSLRSQAEGQERLVFLLGVDALAELHTWHEPQSLLNELEIVLLDRPTGAEPGWDIAERHFPGIRRDLRVVHVAQLAISASDIRERVRSGRPFRYLLPEKVVQHIEERRLYRD